MFPVLAFFLGAWLHYNSNDNIHISTHMLFSIRRMRCYYYANNFRITTIPTTSNANIEISTHKFFSFRRHRIIFDVCVVITAQTIFAFQRFQLIATLTPNFRRISFFRFDDNATFWTY